MFNFVVKYLGKLKYVPLLPLIFDSLLTIWTFIFNKEVVHCIEEIEKEISSWEGISVSLHKFGGMQFNYQNQEIGHIHGNGLTDILFNKKIKRALIEQGKAKEHHIFKNSGWVSFYISTQSDKDKVIDLLERSYQIKKKGK